jgi:tagaturonate reductase
MEVLSKKIVEKKTAKITVMQFGEGNFLRAFIDWLIQKMNDSGKYTGHVVVVQPLPAGRVQSLADQDGLYTLILQGLNENGEAVKQHQVIDVIDDVINPYTQWAKYLTYAESTDLQVVISNTTEAGIAFDPSDLTVDFKTGTPSSYPGKLLALLAHRFDVLGMDSGLAIIPCELIDDNGDQLRSVLLELAQGRKMSQEFQNYLTTSCHFTSTLVDRIVPGFPKEEFASLCQDFGYIDNNMDKGEYFHLFVLKNEPFVERKFPVDRIGLHAIYVPDIHPYKQRKVRILNGTHTTLVPVAYLAGFDEVRQSLLDPDIHRFILEEQKEEILPTITTADAQAFADDVLKRFLNPYVHHALMSIALNSVSKFKERDLPTILDDITADRVPSHMLFAFASLFVFYRGYRVVNGERQDIALQDDPNIIAFFQKVWKDYDADKDLEKLVSSILARDDFWGQDLSKNTVLSEGVRKYLAQLLAAPSQQQAIKDFLAHE